MPLNVYDRYLFITIGLVSSISTSNPYAADISMVNYVLPYLPAKLLNYTSNV